MAAHAGGPSTEAPPEAPQPAVVLLGAGVWRSDNERSRCASCNESFSMTRRRHHCRACGDIFCHKCSSWQADLEDASGRPLKSQRVCLSCQQELAEDRGTPLWHAVGRMRYFYALKHRGIDANALGGMSESERRNALADARVDPLDFEAVAASVAALSDDARIPSGIDAVAPLPSAAAASQQPQLRLRAISQLVHKGSACPQRRVDCGRCRAKMTACQEEDHKQSCSGTAQVSDIAALKELALLQNRQLAQQVTKLQGEQDAIRKLVETTFALAASRWLPSASTYSPTPARTCLGGTRCSPRATTAAPSGAPAAAASSPFPTSSTGASPPRSSSWRTTRPSSASP
eukprot:TRINITY_DN4909_c0_g1_i5.p1 TRINITY_DN4909_c0_g1~~TRINITY_DN4909_c0_g1_i5.p1  ORF type:complete len:345 (+),score=49.96 TRINITY_DN4909_c0_g1_i5:91-1125(+)